MIISDIGCTLITDSFNIVHVLLPVDKYPLAQVSKVSILIGPLYLYSYSPLAKKIIKYITSYRKYYIFNNIFKYLYLKCK